MPGSSQIPPPAGTPKRGPPPGTATPASGPSIDPTPPSPHTPSPQTGGCPHPGPRAPWTRRATATASAPPKTQVWPGDRARPSVLSLHALEGEWALQPSPPHTCTETAEHFEGRLAHPTSGGRHCCWPCLCGHSSLLGADSNPSQGETRHKSPVCSTRLGETISALREDRVSEQCCVAHRLLRF